MEIKFEKDILNLPDPQPIGKGNLFLFALMLSFSIMNFIVGNIFAAYICLFSASAILGIIVFTFFNAKKIKKYRFLLRTYVEITEQPELKEVGRTIVFTYAYPNDQYWEELKKHNQFSIQ